MGTQIPIGEIMAARWAIWDEFEPKIKAWCRPKFEHYADEVLDKAQMHFLEHHNLEMQFECAAHRTGAIISYIKQACKNAYNCYAYAPVYRKKMADEDEQEPEWGYTWGLGSNHRFINVSFDAMADYSSDDYSTELDIATSHIDDPFEFVERDAQYKILRNAISQFDERAQIALRYIMKGNLQVEAAAKAGVSEAAVSVWCKKLKGAIVEAAKTNKYVQLPKEYYTQPAIQAEATKQPELVEEKPVYILRKKGKPAEVQSPVQEAPAVIPEVVIPIPEIIPASISQMPGYAEYQQSQLNLFFGMDESVPFAEDIAVLNRKKRTQNKSGSSKSPLPSQQAIKPVQVELAFDAPPPTAEIPAVATPTTASSAPTLAAQPTPPLQVMPGYVDYRDRQLANFYDSTPIPAYPLSRSKIAFMQADGLPPPGIPPPYAQSRADPIR